jgi:hypothetical protein
VPCEIPLDVVPPDLQIIGSEFWMVFNRRREVVGVERLAEESLTEANTALDQGPRRSS